MTVSGDCAIWLYGSHARGDADSLSDVDLLVVSDHTINKDVITSIVGSTSHVSIALYGWREIEGMAAYGSLFLRHLQLEAYAILEDMAVRDRLGQLLSMLPRYSLATRDVIGFHTVLNDVRSSLNSDPHLVFELATIATLFRHACILGCALSGDHCFSRFEPVTRVVRRWGLASSWSREFPSLYSYRMYADARSAPPGKPSRDMVQLWCDRAEVLLSEIEVRINEFN